MYIYVSNIKWECFSIRGGSRDFFTSAMLFVNYSSAKVAIVGFLVEAYVELIGRRTRFSMSLAQAYDDSCVSELLSAVAEMEIQNASLHEQKLRLDSSLSN